jgi:formylglycine-generating enzyme required for sulfatase activity/tetratricopeptide (TPR) repeat protein
MIRQGIGRFQILLTGFFALLTGPSIAGEKWTDATGSYSVEADFISLEPARVTLKKQDGSICVIPVQKLGDDDLQYLRQLLADKGAPSIRKWADITGTYTLDAEFVTAQPESITLKKDDGNEIRIPLEKLSPHDQLRARNHAAHSNEIAKTRRVIAQRVLSDVAARLDDAREQIATDPGAVVKSLKQLLDSAEQVTELNDEERDDVKKRASSLIYRAEQELLARNQPSAVQVVPSKSNGDKVPSQQFVGIPPASDQSMDSSIQLLRSATECAVKCPDSEARARLLVKITHLALTSGNKDAADAALKGLLNCTPPREKVDIVQRLALKARLGNIDGALADTNHTEIASPDVLFQIAMDCEEYGDRDTLSAVQRRSQSVLVALTNAESQFGLVMAFAHAKARLGQNAATEVNQLSKLAAAIPDCCRRADALRNLAEVQATRDKATALKTLALAADSARSYQSVIGLTGLLPIQNPAAMRADNEFFQKGLSLSFIASLEFKLGDVKVARATVQDALRAEPLAESFEGANASAYMAIADALVDLGQYDEAIALCRKIRPADLRESNQSQLDDRANIKRAISAARDGKSGEAVAIVGKITDDESQLNGLTNVVEDLAAAGNISAAQHVSNEAVAKSGVSPIDWVDYSSGSYALVRVCARYRLNTNCLSLIEKATEQEEKADLYIAMAMGTLESVGRIPKTGLLPFWSPTDLVAYPGGVSFVITPLATNVTSQTNIENGRDPKTSSSAKDAAEGPAFNTADGLRPSENHKVPAQRETTAPIPNVAHAETKPRDAITNSIGMKLTLIPAGEFMMGGSETAEQLRHAGFYVDGLGDFTASTEAPRHRVRISKSFFLGTHEVTRGQFRQFCAAAGYVTQAELDGQPGEGRQPRSSWKNVAGQTDEHPVVNVNWNDAVAFCRWLSKKEGKVYRLPTEAEWEYACRAGSTTRFWTGDSPDSLSGAANVFDKSFDTKSLKRFRFDDGWRNTAPVGTFKPNAFGLYDMTGNVSEMCQDWWDIYSNAPFEDPAGPTKGAGRVVRGGSYLDGPFDCRSAHRRSMEPLVYDEWTGFRVVCESH